MGAHLANAEHNEEVRMGESYGLTATTITEQIAELTRLGSHARTSQPIYHVHIDPPEGWGKEARDRYKELLLKEFGLEGRPYASAIHEKNGRTHEHLAILRVDASGKAIRLDNDFQRREKISRIVEHEFGMPFTKGAHNRAVIHALRDERPEIAQAMEFQGLHEGTRPRANTTPKERMQEERTHISKRDVAMVTSQAWSTSDSPQAFMAALREQGLTLAQGEKTQVILDASGNTHSLARMLSMHARQNGEPAPKSADIQSRLAGMELPSLDVARAQVAQVQPVQVAATPQPDPTPPTGGGVEVAPVRDVAPPSITATSTGGQIERAHAGTHAQGTPSPKSGGGGGGGGSSPSSSDSQSSPLPSLDVGAGPGEPPGHNATPEQKARFAAKLADYEDRKAKAWLAFIRAWDAQNKPKKSGAPKGGEISDVDEKGIREAASRLIERIQDAAERGATLRAFYAAWDQFRGYNETSEAGLGNPGEGTPRPDEIHGPGRGNRERAHGEDGPAQRGRIPERDNGTPGGRGDGHQDAERDERTPRPHRTAFEIAVERTQRDMSASIADMSDLRAAMRGPCPLEGLEGKERKEKLGALNKELHAEFRASQREDFSEALARERMRAHPLAKALRALPKRNLTPEQERDRTQGWTDIKAAKEALILRLKEAQKVNGKAAFRQFVELKSHTDSRAFALWTEMKVTAERNRKIASELSRADEKMASLKASEPQGERDPEKAAKAAKSALFEPLIRAQEKLKDAIDNLEKTPPPAGLRWWNPWAHSAHKAAKAAVEIAHARVDASVPDHLKIAFEESKARSAARSAAAWDAGPGKELRALVHGVQAIRDALENRDYRTRETLVNGGLEAALELIRKREAEEQRRREIEAARAAKRGNVYGFPDRQNQQGMEMPAPRMR